MTIPVMDRLSGVKRTNIDWLWWPLLASGKITMLSGDPGVGKSYMTCDVVARYSRGAAMPWQGAIEKPKRGDVLMLSAEDDMADTLVPRLEACHADLDRVHVLHWMEVNNQIEHIDLARHAERIRTVLAENPRIGLIVIDPVSAYLSSTDTNNNASVRAALHPLQCVAHDMGVCVLAVSHLRKESAKNPVHATIGSLAFTAAARLVWLAKRAAGDHDQVVLHPIKVNLCNAHWGYVYTIDEEGVHWRERLTIEESGKRIGLDEHAAMPASEPKIEACAAYLQERLTGPPIRSVELIDECRQRGWSRSTMHIAAKQIGAESFKDGGCWWVRPAGKRQDSTGGPSLLDLEDQENGDGEAA